LEALAHTAKLLEFLLNWRVILDILLFAAGLFFLYRTLLRLGTWQIVAGIGFAIAVFFVASMLDLKSIKWVYSNVSHVAVIGLIVIFQPELRKILERAVSLRRRGLGKGGAALSLVIADAIFTLAEQRRGAILVFPGKEPVKERLAGGWPLNADPTFPLVLSIFDPNSPGHDGGLVIEKGRLTQFGVRLPISKTNRLSAELGTRHHAAMGLSEECDALVIVVSEERGTVIIFSNGKHNVSRDRNEVDSIIATHWEKTASYAPMSYKERKGWILFTEIATCLVVAIVFWLTVILAQAEIREKGFTAPIEYVSIPERLALIGVKPTEVKLHLAGPKSELDEIEPSQLGVKIDLSRAMAGKQLFDISNDNVALPRGVKLVGAEPSNLSLRLEEIVVRKVAIQPQLVGNLPKGLKLVSIKLNPRELDVLSPSGDKKETVNLVTTPIYLETIEGNVKLLARIIAPPNVKPAEKSWPEIEVMIKVKPRP
jgi:DNA integrity scanning protein DisA with diadenylate cyclase activity